MENDPSPKSWDLLPIGDRRCCEQMAPGFACGQKDIVGGVPHLRMNNITTDGLPDFTLVRRIPQSVADKASKWLEPGDVLFCNTNSTELVGKSCIFTGWTERCTFSNHLTRLRTNKERVVNEWLLLCLRHLWLNGYFATHCREFVGQSAFNMGKLGSVRIAIPPKDVQLRVVARIDALMTRAEQAKKVLVEAQAELSLFMPALLAKAFRGDL